MYLAFGSLVSFCGVAHLYFLFVRQRFFSPQRREVSATNLYLIVPNACFPFSIFHFPFSIFHSLFSIFHFVFSHYQHTAMPQEPMYYSTYLSLDKVLNSQQPVSFQSNNAPAHDEMLFIIIHQAYELWFKQILFELDYVTTVFSKEKINDNSEDINLVRHRLHRIIKIFELLNQQVSVLDTMTPLDFLEFRNLLTPSSGFQSKQFRLIEAKLDCN
jgi:hypothetical protein